MDAAKDVAEDFFGDLADGRDAGDTGDTGIEEGSGAEVQEEDGGIGSDRRGTGPEALFYASMEQKLLDAKALVKLGVIVGGACIAEPWPRDAKGKPKVFINGYENRNDVNELLKWLYGDEDGLKGCLEFLGSDLDANVMLTGIGLPPREGRAA
jgi:hypothetical protein